MRRYIAGTLLFLLIAESSGPALAEVPSRSARTTNFARSVAALGSPANTTHPQIYHTPVPRRPLPNYRDPHRYARLIPKPRVPAVALRLTRPIDLVKLHNLEHGQLAIERNPQAVRLRPMRGHLGLRPLASPPPSTTGIVPWWAYATRSIPGLGEGMVNVANLNFLVVANDAEIPEGELDLSLTRTYNSQSGHDRQNDDGSTPAVFGNHWTNNLDVHLGWLQIDSTHGYVSVYTADGARDDYTCEINIVTACTSDTPGVYDLLGTLDVNGGVACQIQWTNKNGVSYIFNAPYAACGVGQGSYGRLTTIYGRNTTFYVTLVYSWSPNDSNPENLSQIVVTHQPDGSQLQLEFAQIAGTKITELMSITRPDGETINYHYDSYGNLTGVDEPGNNPILPAGETMPTEFADGTPIALGNVPQTYDIGSQGTVLEVCGPRAAITILDDSMSDGACVDFNYSNGQLSAWWTRGVLNPTPPDNVLSPSAIQSGPSTGFVQWNDTTFFTNTICNQDSADEMQDAYGHVALWCFDANGRVVETSQLVSGTTWLGTSQTWDSNNDLASMTDARGLTTYMAYDSSGNVVEVSLPSQNTSQGTMRPTDLFDHDSYNNLISYCDPANLSQSENSWNPNPGPTPCSSSGSTHYSKFTYNASDPNEIYGCLSAFRTPSSYHRAVTYGVNCGNGLPTEIAGDTISQPIDNSTRTPTQTFTYNTNGTLQAYGEGGPHNATWVLSYANNGMNRVGSVQDPDGPTSYRCYNLDGSVLYSETPYQNQLDNSNCPSVQQLVNKTATPPPYAIAYGYDADGNVATLLHHHNCTTGAGNCAANSENAATKCSGVEVPFGTICDFYDGLDRLVEVKLPFDTVHDLYANPWITRYLYDLTGSQYSYQGNSISAYGNLFETEELLPSNPSPSVTAPPSPGSVTNGSYEPIKATAYDGLDRPVVKYSGIGSATYTTQTLTWDTSPLDGNVEGYLGEDCNSASPQQCQEFDYLADGEELTFNSSDGSSPERGYTYDPDGRPTQITLGGYASPQVYAYDVDGNPATSTDASSGTGGRATLTHNRYADGTEESLDVSSAALSQPGLFTYSYRNDGPLQTFVINDASVGGIANPGKTTVSYTYTNGERLNGRTESGPAANTSLPATSITYGPVTGLVSQETTPVTQLSTFKYTVESELTAVTSSGSNPECFSQSVTFVYSLRGELINNDCSADGSVPFLANGVTLRAPLVLGGQQYTWNDLMAVTTNVSSTQGGCNGGSCYSAWNYNDGAGRMTAELGPYPPAPGITPPPVETTTARSYDAENHLLKTVFQDSQQGFENEAVSWGPDGHPLNIGTYIGSNPEKDERLHWDADQLLFTTHLVNGTAALDDIKIHADGDILPGDSGYAGLTFYDRGPGGTILGCHNYTGTSYVGISDPWTATSFSPCKSNQNGEMPTSGVWGANPYWYNFYASNTPIGGGGTITMPRKDGYNDGFDTIQGVRSYNNTAGVWTTPDASAGFLDNPASQKSYMWNGNNPMDNEDSTGYFTTVPQPVSTPQPLPAAPGAPGGSGASGGLKEIGHVFGHCYGGCSVAVVLTCRPACMEASPTKQQQQACQKAMDAFTSAGGDPLSLEPLVPGLSGVSNKYSDPEAQGRESEVEALQAQAVGALPSLLDFYINLLAMPGMNHAQRAATRQVQENCIISVSG